MVRTLDGICSINDANTAVKVYPLPGFMIAGNVFLSWANAVAGEWEGVVDSIGSNQRAGSRRAGHCPRIDWSGQCVPYYGRLGKSGSSRCSTFSLRRLNVRRILVP